MPRKKEIRIDVELAGCRDDCFNCLYTDCVVNHWKQTDADRRERKRDYERKNREKRNACARERRRLAKLDAMTSTQ